MSRNFHSLLIEFEAGSSLACDVEFGGALQIGVPPNGHSAICLSAINEVVGAILLRREIVSAPLSGARSMFARPEQSAHINPQAWEMQ